MKGNEHGSDMLRFVFQNSGQKTRAYGLFPAHDHIVTKGGGWGRSSGWCQPTSVFFPSTMLLSPIWDLDLGWDWLTAFGGPVSLDPTPVHGDAIDLAGGVKERLYEPLRLAPEYMGSR